MKDYYPRMTPKVRSLMCRAELRELVREEQERDMSRDSSKYLLMSLIWDDWLKIVEDPLCDIQLTERGQKWLLNDRQRRVERGL